MAKVDVSRSEFKNLPVNFSMRLAQSLTGDRDLSVAEARAVADRIHDLCDELEKEQANAVS